MSFRFKDMEAYNTWQAARNVNLTPSAALVTDKDIPPDKGKESRLQAKIEQYCREHGWPFFHDRSRKKNTPGWPDLSICMPRGIVLFLELKSAKGVMRPEQAHIRQQMKYLGHHHFVVKSYREFLSIIMDHNYAMSL